MDNRRCRREKTNINTLENKSTSSRESLRYLEARFHLVLPTFVNSVKRSGFLIHCLGRFPMPTTHTEKEEWAARCYEELLIHVSFVMEEQLLYYKTCLPT